MRFLCLSDIHGNATALDRVLAEAKAWEFHQLVVCGDSLFPGPEPLRTWKTLLEHRAVCVQGLVDRAVSTLDPDSLSPQNEVEEARVRALEDLQSSVGELIITALRRLRPNVRLPLESGQEMLVVHGSPRDPTESLSLEMTDDEIYALLGGDAPSLVICGASHVPFDRTIGDVRVVNVGSVGESPTPGIANATIIESFKLGFKVEQFEVQLTNS